MRTFFIVHNYRPSENNMPFADTEIFSESCNTKSNLDCNYTVPIDLAPNGLQFDQSEPCNYNPNLVWIYKIQKIFLCVAPDFDTKTTVTRHFFFINKNLSKFLSYHFHHYRNIERSIHFPGRLLQYTGYRIA